MTELLKQPQYSPFGINDQILSIFAGTQGYLDDLPVSQVLEFESRLLQHFHDEYPEIVEELDETGKLGDELDAKMREVIEAFKTHFVREHEPAGGEAVD